jgi:hypothetical protein
MMESRILLFGDPDFDDIKSTLEEDKNLPGSNGDNENSDEDCSENEEDKD